MFIIGYTTAFHNHISVIYGDRPFYDYRTHHGLTIVNVKFSIPAGRLDLRKTIDMCIEEIRAENEGRIES